MHVADLFTTLPEGVGAGVITVSVQGALERTAARDSGSLYDEMQRRELTLEGMEDALIQEAVGRADGNLAAAARALGLTRPQLCCRLERARERARC